MASKTIKDTKKKPPKEKKHGKRFLKILKNFFLLGVIVFCIGLLAGIVILISVADDIPQAIAPQPPVTSYLMDSEGEVFARLHAGENRNPITLDQIPKNLQYATIAIEDERFYKHIGIDIKGIMRAVFVNISSMSKKQGASTITQQLARNAFLTREKTWDRKIKEQMLAVQLERKFSKEQILEFYLNQVNYGSGANGVELASEIYFGKEAPELTLAECALIAGIPKAPTYYSPYKNYDNALARRDLVLDAMADQGYITTSQATEAKQEVPALIQTTEESEEQVRIAPYFTDFIINELYKLGYDEQEIFRGGLRVYTTLDQKMQNDAETTVRESVSSGILKGEIDSNGIEQPQIAVVTVVPSTGHIKAMVGGRDYQKTKFNRAVQALRQPGSAFKPFVYAAALENGMTAATMIEDKAYRYGSWSPRNYSGGYQGPTIIAYALQKSINTVAVETMHQVGVDKVLDLTERMGVTTIVREGSVNDKQLATALGGMTKGISPLEMASAYGVFANGGIWVKPSGILRIEDRHGNVLYKGETTKKKAISPQVAYIMVTMMKNVINGGTGSRASLSRPVAGKTGTTSDYTDAWFVGYTPDLATAVWIGGDDANAGKAYMRRNRVSSSYAAGVWGKYMRKAVQGIPARDFKRPGDVAGPIAVSRISGLLPGEFCAEDEGMGVYFLKGTVPTEVCALHIATPGGIMLPDGTIIPYEEELPIIPLPEPGEPGAQPGTNPEITQPGGTVDPGPGTSTGEGTDKMVYVLVCTESGYLATENCRNNELKRFKLGEQPTEYCPIH